MNVEDEVKRLIRLNRVLTACIAGLSVLVAVLFYLDLGTPVRALTVREQFTLADEGGRARAQIQLGHPMVTYSPDEVDKPVLFSLHDPFAPAYTESVLSAEDLSFRTADGGATQLSANGLRFLNKDGSSVVLGPTGWRFYDRNGSLTREVALDVDSREGELPKQR